jgi:hypothetical protein
LYPQHYFGFEVDNEIAQRLELSEAYGLYELGSNEEEFFDKFEEKYGVYPYTLKDTTTGPGSYIQSLKGFNENSVYVCFHPASIGDDRWQSMISSLEDLNIYVKEGRWSEVI